MSNDAADAALAVEYLTMTRIGEKGQLTVPKGCPDDVHLESGAPMAALRLGDALIIMPKQDRFNALRKSIVSALEGINVADSDLQATLPDVRRCVFDRRCVNPAEAEVVANRFFIRHLADAPVLLSAVDSKPGWELTRNTKHLPMDFFTALAGG